MRDLVMNFQAPINDQSLNNLHTLLTIAIDRPVRPTSITILINSLGGGIHVGIASYTFIRSLPVPVTTINIGNVDSAANMVFLAGKRRLAAPASTFHLHGGTRGFNGPQNLAALEEAISSLRSDNDRMAEVFAIETKFDRVQLRDIVIQGRTLNAAQAMEAGMIEGIQPFIMPIGAEVMQVAAVF